MQTDIPKSQKVFPYFAWGNPSISHSAMEKEIMMNSHVKCGVYTLF